MSAPRSTQPQELTAKDFAVVRDLICDHCGIYYSVEHTSRLWRVVYGRLNALGLDSVDAYLEILRSDLEGTAEMGRLVDEVTNTETYFFREEFQLDTFSREILPELVRLRSSRRRLTIWSGGCSSGEEVFTLAMLIQSSPLWERGLRGRWEIRILGTDINRPVLRRARAGLYSASSFKGLEPERRREIQASFFRKESNRFRVNPSLKEMVSFLNLNLLDRDATGVIGEVDVVFCRNVVMYFPRDIRLQVIRKFYQKLSRGGYLLLGHSENLLGLDTPFEAIHLKHDLVYRKPRTSGEGAR